MYISLIENIRSSLIHLHGFQQHVLLPLLKEIISLVVSNRIDLLCLKPSSDKPAIVAKGFLELSNLFMIIK